MVSFSLGPGHAMKRREHVHEWKMLSPIAITMARKLGLCNHELGESFILRHPYNELAKCAARCGTSKSSTPGAWPWGSPPEGQTMKPATVCAGPVKAGLFARCERQGWTWSCREETNKHELDRESS